jgi:hypothetical protein
MTDEIHFMTDEIHFMTEPTLLLQIVGWLIK